MGEWAWIGRVIDRLSLVLEPAAVAFAVVSGMLFYFYRRDHIVKQVDLRKENDRLISVIEKVTEAVNASTSTQRIGIEATTRQFEAFDKQFDSITRAFERERDRRR